MPPEALFRRHHYLNKNSYKTNTYIKYPALAKDCAFKYSVKSVCYTAAMNARISTIVSRWLVMVMALTFLSPALGAQRVADHAQLHTTAHAADAAPSAHEHDTDDDHNDAHALIGHLLLHMPFFSADVFQAVVPHQIRREEIPAPLLLPTLSIPELPFKPPRASFV